MAKSSQLSLFVITPERQVVSEQAEQVSFTAHDGEVGVLPGRAALMCELGVGQVRYRSAGQTRRVFIDGGFAQVVNDKVTILTDMAVAAEEITPTQISAAQQLAAESPGGSAEAFQKRQRAQRRVRVLQSLAQR